MSLKQKLKQAKKIEQASRQREQMLEDCTNQTHISLSRGAVKPRNYLALNPLLKKGGVHAKDDVDIVRKKRRRETKQKLRKTDWLSEI